MNPLISEPDQYMDLAEILVEILNDESPRLRQQIRDGVQRGLMHLTRELWIDSLALVIHSKLNGLVRGNQSCA